MITVINVNKNFKMAFSAQISDHPLMFLDRGMIRSPIRCEEYVALHFPSALQSHSGLP